MSITEIAGQIKESSRAADAVLDDYREHPSRDVSKLAQAIKKYIGIKLQLPQEEISDNITLMVRYSISSATGIPIEKLKEMDRPGACGSAPAVLAKRILLFLNVQDKLGVKMPPADAGKIQTVMELAEELLPLMQ